jgi:hypothetical protein
MIAKRGFAGMFGLPVRFIAAPLPTQPTGIGLAWIDAIRYWIGTPA